MYTLMAAIVLVARDVVWLSSPLGETPGRQPRHDHGGFARILRQHPSEPRTGRAAEPASGRHRPPVKRCKGMTSRVKVLLSQSVQEDLQRLADRQGHSLSQVIRHHLETVTTLELSPDDPPSRPGTSLWPLSSRRGEQRPKRGQVR